MTTLLLKNIGTLVSGDIANPIVQADAIWIDQGVIKKAGHLKDMDAKKAAAYALAARSWAFMDDDLSPFADFFDLQLQTQRDMKTKFVDRLLAGNEIAVVTPP